MRNLTIKREKTYVASLAKVNVYIEDPVSYELMIGQVPCRKIGELKNDEEKTFQISENATRVLLGDRSTRNFHHEFYQIPAGESDVYLSGKNHYDPFNGNPFYFNGVRDEKTLEKRKKGRRTGIIIFVVAILAGVAVGVLRGMLPTLLANDDPMVFSSNDFEITLTEEFELDTWEGYDACYTSNDVVLLMLKEDFTYFEEGGTLSLTQYGEMLIESMELGSTVTVQEEAGLTFFEYQYSESEDTFHYFTVLLKNSDAYWVAQFIMFEEDAEAYRQACIDWAKTIQFTK